MKVLSFSFGMTSSHRLQPSLKKPWSPCSRKNHSWDGESNSKSPTYCPSSLSRFRNWRIFPSLLSTPLPRQNRKEYSLMLTKEREGGSRVWQWQLLLFNMSVWNLRFSKVYTIIYWLVSLKLFLNGDNKSAIAHSQCNFWIIKYTKTWE